MIDVAEQQAGVGAMNDDANVFVDSYRQEIRVFRLVELVQSKAGVSRIHLQQAAVTQTHGAVKGDVYRAAASIVRKIRPLRLEDPSLRSG